MCQRSLCKFTFRGVLSTVQRIGTEEGIAPSGAGKVSSNRVSTSVSSCPDPPTVPLAICLLLLSTRCQGGHMAWGCPGGQGSINPAALQGRLTTHSASGSSYVRDSCKQGRGSQAVPSPLGAPAPKPQPFSAPAPCAL